jgi:gliding motility-associated-like protein
MPVVSDTTTYTAIDYSVIGAMNYPGGLSSILRNNDDLYGFICNDADSTLTRIDFFQCNKSTIPSYTEVKPPVYSYDSPGVYNVYFVVNQGLPTQQVACKTITVIQYPPINLHVDTTLCPGDTVRLYAVSTLADSIRWTSTYNIDTINILQDSVRVFPGYTYTYPIIAYYPFGCIVDTSITITVSQVHADAGPDRWILDGASTTLGGPNTSVFNPGPFYTYPTGDSGYSYNWTPFQFLNDTLDPYTVATPAYDMTYYLTVTELNDTFRCQARDTVIVHVDCGAIYLPNAFSPTSENVLTNTFGIINQEIAQLNYLRIYDRWGNLVYQTGSLSGRWDGTYNGKLCEEGVYAYIADAFCQDGKEIKKTGNVTLFR